VETLSHHELMVFFLSLGVLLFSARGLGELARRYHQPAVLGELVAGILLGPTVLGSVAPAWHALLFPQTAHLSIALQGLTMLGIVLFLLVAGMEVDLSSIWRQGRSALIIGLSGIGFPFALGFASAWFLPQLLGIHKEADPFIFALFFATALSITALPVIAKILMDLNLYRSDLGMMIVAAAVFNDLIGWIIFAIILGVMGKGVGQEMPVEYTVVFTLCFAALVLTLGKWAVHRSLPWIQAHTSWPGGVLGFAVSLALLGAACTEWIGIHGIFGAFLFGIALGESHHLHEHTRATLDQFISFIFAPLFFASIGLRVNFFTHFDLWLTLTVLTIATAGKVLGCFLGGRWSGFSSREAWALGFGMNARGAMEIILGLLALQADIIRQRMFVALVVMALVTSMTSGAFMQRLLGLGRKQGVRFVDFLSSRAFQNALQASERRQAIQELVQLACEGKEVNPEMVGHRVWARELMMPTSLPHGVAVPHAQVPGLQKPLLAVGMSWSGVDFDAEDGALTRLLILILTPEDDHNAQVEILADISRMFQDPKAVEQVLRANTYTEFLALLKTNSVS
jgi:Kef-type K+ transport system membrane component KefB/mannitol/fructose-specific phosphotransferase system IIA component (Ntr-type)